MGRGLVETDGTNKKEGRKGDRQTFGMKQKKYFFPKKQLINKTS